MAKQQDGYLSAKESRRISKENRRITDQYEKQRKRKSDSCCSRHQCTNRINPRFSLCGHPGLFPRKTLIVLIFGGTETKFVIFRFFLHRRSSFHCKALSVFHFFLQLL